jgi:hypothetical protein
MISEKEMMDYLSGKMSDEMKKVFLMELEMSKDDSLRFRELKAIRDGVCFYGMITEVESDLRASGFFEQSPVSVRRFKSWSSLGLVAGILLIGFALLISYSTIFYSNQSLIRDGMSAFEAVLEIENLNAKGEWLELAESGRNHDPIIQSVLNAFQEEDYELVLDQIQKGRNNNNLIDVDFMHLDWMEIQVMLIMDKPVSEVRQLIETIADNKQHYYNAYARDLLEKHSSLWRKFIL